MSAYADLSRRCRNMVAAGLAFVLPLSALALDPVPPEALSVKVFADRYVAAGKPFSDLAALEAWAKPMRSRVLWLDSCGPASKGQLLAAVERLHTVYVEGVQIRTFAEGEPACVATAAQASGVRDSVSREVTGLPYYASDKSGRSLVP